MSTICKLDPTVRVRRHARASALVGLRKSIHLLTDLPRIRMSVVLAYLEAVQRNPRMSSVEKQRRFDRALFGEAPSVAA